MSEWNDVRYKLPPVNDEGLSDYLFVYERGDCRLGRYSQKLYESNTNHTESESIKKYARHSSWYVNGRHVHIAVSHYREIEYPDTSKIENYE